VTPEVPTQAHTTGARTAKAIALARGVEPRVDSLPAMFSRGMDTLYSIMTLLREFETSDKVDVDTVGHKTAQSQSLELSPGCEVPAPYEVFKAQ
jgi:hypothetical protein